MTPPTTMLFKLHHLSIIVGSMSKSLAYYRDVLGHKVVAHFDTPQDNIAFLSAGSDLLLELVTWPSLTDSEIRFATKRGHAFHHIAFSVDNVDSAFAELEAQGVQIAWEPDDYLFVRHCGVYDDCGNIVEILCEKEPLPIVREPAPFQLHHPCIFSDNWQRTQRFYEKHFGLRCPFQYIYDHGGAFIYLTDPHFDADDHNCMIEIIGPPYQEAREFAFSEKYGTGFDHSGYVVADAEAAFAEVMRRGGNRAYDPYSDYGTQMSWVRDADGNDLELMLPLANEKLLAALRDGEIVRPNGHSTKKFD